MELLHVEAYPNTGAVTHGPVAGLILQQARVNGFTESGSFTSLSFGEQIRNSEVGVLGYQVRLLGQMASLRPTRVGSRTRPARPDSDGAAGPKSRHRFWRPNWVEPLALTFNSAKPSASTDVYFRRREAAECLMCFDVC
jgi:hypothetical protein